MFLKQADCFVAYIVIEDPVPKPQQFRAHHLIHGNFFPTGLVFSCHKVVLASV